MKQLLNLDVIKIRDTCSTNKILNRLNSKCHCLLLCSKFSIPNLKGSFHWYKINLISRAVGFDKIQKMMVILKYFKNHVQFAK